MAEWSKALVLGTSRFGRRGFESHRCQVSFLRHENLGRIQLDWNTKVRYLRKSAPPPPDSRLRNVCLALWLYFTVPTAFICFCFVTKDLTAKLSRTGTKTKKRYWKPRPKQNMNKIDASSISVYARQMVGLAVTAEIRSITVCAFMLFYDGHKVEASSIYTSIYHSGKFQSPWHFPIWDLFSSFSLSFFLYFILSVVS